MSEVAWVKDIPVGGSVHVAADDNDSGLSYTVNPEGRSNMEFYYNIVGATADAIYVEGSMTGPPEAYVWRPCDEVPNPHGEDVLFYYNAYHYVRVRCPTINVEIVLEVTFVRC